MKDLNAREILTIVPLLGLSAFLGVYPKPVLERLEPSVKALIVHVEQNSDWCESDHRAADGSCERGDRFDRAEPEASEGAETPETEGEGG
jgi:NADH-quinone oxidoreductase subunit M